MIVISPLWEMLTDGDDVAQLPLNAGPTQFLFFETI